MPMSAGQRKAVGLFSDDMDRDVNIFSSTKHRIMLTLKREGESDLDGLSKKLKISKMAVYKHLKELERRGLVESEPEKRGAGRPRLLFRPTAGSASIYPKGYGRLSLALLDFVERELGRDAAVGVLRDLQSERIEEDVRVAQAGSLNGKVRRLSRVRDSVGFMSGVEETDEGIELLEHNCAIPAVAQKYPEVCEAERLAFEKALGAKVELLVSSPEGGPACRFRFTPR